MLGKCIKWGAFSNLATRFDEDFVLFVVKYYDKVHKKEDKKEKLVGIKMDEAWSIFMIQWQSMERILKLDRKIHNDIKEFDCSQEK